LPARSVLAWNATGRTLTANTGETVSDATAVTPSTTQHLGSISGSSEFASGVVQMIAVFPTKLSSSEVAALVGDVYTGYTMSYFDDFNSLDIVGPKTPFGKYFATRPYGFTSGPSVDFRSTTTNSLYFPDPLHTGHLDFGRGVTYGYENVRVASSILTLQSRLATAGENMTFVNPAANMNVSFMLHTAGAAIYYPSYMAAVIVEARIRLKPAAASALAGWNASFWTLSGAPVVVGTNTADEWDFFENFVDKQLQFNHNTWSGGSKVSDTIGNYATGRVWDAQFHTFTAVLVNGGFVKLYVDGVETFSAARQANTAAKPMFILFYAAINQAFNQADWTASGSTSISGNSMDVDWFKIWRKIGNPHFVGQQSISSLSVDYASSGSIVLPGASSLWGTTTIQEYVQCVPLEPNEPGTTLTTSYQQFPSGVSYDSLTRTISVNFTGGTGSAGANHCMVYGYGPGATGEPARFNIYRGPNITTGMLTAIRGSPYSHDFYFECDVGIMTPKEIKVTGLPAGLIFDNVSTVSGIPTSAGSSSLSVSCTNNNGQNKTTTVPMNVSD
jgi:hypothetical protein